MEIKINSAEIRSGMFLKWNYEEIKPERRTSFSCNADGPIQEELKEAFQKLLPHFLLLTEMKGRKEVIESLDLGNELPEEITTKYKVTSFATKDKNGDITVEIKGVKHLNIGKTIGIPEFYDQMIEIVEEIKNHILDYMDGKQSERVQVEMEFGDEDEFTPEVEHESHAA
jgi:hypothetical protein